MIRKLCAVALVVLVSGCGDGQPFSDLQQTDTTTDPGTDTGTTDTTGIGGDGTPTATPQPPGTAAPTPDASIFRYEESNDAGGGFVQDVSYNATDDTFSVDNLAFDGFNTYTRDGLVGTLSSAGNPTVYAVYEGAQTVADSLTGNPIDQFDYSAIYGVSANTTVVNGVTLPRSRFAIVRTGSYVDYGFGGFVYERNGSVVMPSTGQAIYMGDYAGIRVFQNASGIEYVTAEMEVAIDFNDFNAGDAVRGRISNREFFEEDGTAIGIGTGENQLPDAPVTFAVGPNSTTVNGEIAGELASYTLDEAGAETIYESGTYYGIIGGPNADEVVGIVVLESADPRTDGVNAQETGGFVLYRDPPT